MSRIFSGIDEHRSLYITQANKEVRRAYDDYKTLERDPEDTLMIGAVRCDYVKCNNAAPILDANGVAVSYISNSRVFSAISSEERKQLEEESKQAWTRLMEAPLPSSWFHVTLGNEKVDLCSARCLRLTGTAFEQKKIHHLPYQLRFHVYGY